MFYRLRDLIDNVLALIKWPVALFSIALLPVLFKTFKHYYYIHTQLSYTNLLYFFCGAGLMFAVRFFLRIRGGAAETMEHEMTHILFAMLTFHRVHNMHVEDYGGGAMSFSGKGNWLIALAPYFFPLAAYGMLFFAMAYVSVANVMPEWIMIGLGAGVGYNLCAFAEQMHPAQTDFKVAGYLFTLCFLPTANLISFTTILAFAERGQRGISFFYQLLEYYFRHTYL